MTVDEFNDKYDEYLEPGHYGLVVDNDNVIKFLDAIFQDLIKIQGFQYSQIKMKFNYSRFYANGISSELQRVIESKINKIVGTEWL